MEVPKGSVENMLSGKVLISSNRSKASDDASSLCKVSNQCMRILIVDDDKNSGEALKSMIEYRGHDTTLLDDGMKFVNRMNEEEFDLIFMDYHTNDLTHHSHPTTSGGSPESSDVPECLGDNYASSSGSESETITGTYVTNLARECYDLKTPVYAYTGDNSSAALNDFKRSKFKGVFVKPVDAVLINSFFDIIEKEIENSKTLDPMSSGSNSKLKRLAIKNKNFIYFGKCVQIKTKKSE